MLTALFWDMLTWHSSETLWLDTFLEHSHSTLLLDTLARRRSLPQTPPLANAIKTWAAQITHTDTSSANAITTEAPRVTHTDTKRHYKCGARRGLLSKCCCICGAQGHSLRRLLCKRHCNCSVTRQLDTLSRPLQMHWRMRRALQRTRRRFGGHSNGCEHKRNIWRTQPCPPDPQSQTETLATHSGKHKVTACCWTNLLSKKLHFKLGSKTSRLLWRASNSRTNTNN